MVDNLDSIPALVPKLLLQLLETGSITEAASILGVSQPAASKALRRAEQQVGIEFAEKRQSALYF